MKIIAGNWKMNGNPELLTEMMAAISAINTNNRVILCVPYTMLRGGNAVVMIGAQNVSKYASGAHTGDISAAFVSATGATATIVGHSECRDALGDKNSDVAMRAKMALENDLLPIICVGETADERDMGLTHKIIRDTLCDMGYFDIPILYGASVNANNSGEIMSIPNVDGVLVGGASLKIDDFIPIIKSVK